MTHPSDSHFVCGHVVLAAQALLWLPCHCRHGPLHPKNGGPSQHGEFGLCRQQANPNTAHCKDLNSPPNNPCLYCRRKPLSAWFSKTLCLLEPIRSFQSSLSRQASEPCTKPILIWVYWRQTASQPVIPDSIGFCICLSYVQSVAVNRKKHRKEPTPCMEQACCCR